MWLNANHLPHREARGVFHNPVASSLPMYKTWEHVNTLFRACINDHGEAHSLSTRAINKKWRSYKSPCLISPPPPGDPAGPTFPPLEPLRQISCQFLTLFYFCVAWGCGAAGVALNNKWRLSEHQTTVGQSLFHSRYSKDSHMCMHTWTQLLWSLLDAPGRKWGVNWSLGNCEIRAAQPGDGA